MTDAFFPIDTTVTELINDAKKHQSFGALFKLHAVWNYLELLECYHCILNIKNPATRLSLAVAKSVGKGPYFVKKICCLVIYINWFCTLPPPRSGKHHEHPSLLNNEQISQAVHRYLTVQEIGEVECQPASRVTWITNTHILPSGYSTEAHV